ncbi:MAG: ABC transporter substrate-binding protein [Sulfolobales archaeon]|nr:ABC transporter substrate-binding protein [Sulfolobales archaeon]MDW7968931.1 ABC transporter substrate-binding protein [Sulfolobales archaeon]
MNKIVTSLIISIMVLNLFCVMPISLKSQQPPKGPWVDEVVFFTESDPDKVVEMMLRNEAQIYFDDLSYPHILRTVKERGLSYTFSYGLYYELTFNPVGPLFPATGKLNPFSNAKIREAMNYIIDRAYIAGEILGGLAVPRYTALTPSFPDYARYADVAYEIESTYKYNFEKGKAIIFEEMQKMGAEFRNGKWYYKGEPVAIKFLIRIEDARKDIGDYVSGQLEKLGFTVEKRYGKSAELSPIWIRGNPANGEWHLYTGGWITTLVNRDEADNFGYFYTKIGRPEPLWQAYENDPEFYAIAQKLYYRNYKSAEERDELMAKALMMSMKESQRIWLVHLASLWVSRPEVSIAYDLAGGYSGSWLWPWTLRYKDKVGGQVKVLSPDLLVEPWNPIAGTNWIFDQSVIRATGETSLLPDPYTGLYWPHRVEKAEVYVKEDLPVRKTLDWVSLIKVGDIVVPGDAWYKWDASQKKIVTVKEALGENVKALAKVIVYYDKELFSGKYKWHDGSTFSIADIIFNFIISHDRADPASPIYDKAYVPDYQAAMETFKGFKIVSKNPLVIEYYTDTWYADAEWIAAVGADDFWPYYLQGPAPWHTLAIGYLAEADRKLAFTADKAKELRVDWMNFIAGPSLEILKSKLQEAISRGFIPYSEVLRDYLSANEPLTRYQNLMNWYNSKGHFWVGNGPFYLEKVDTIAKQIVLRAYRGHVDSADKWLKFGEPMIPELSIQPIGTVIQTQPVVRNLTISTHGIPYRADDLLYVKYLLVHPGGKLTGFAEAVKDGLYQVRLGPDVTGALEEGTAELIIIAVSKLVGTPSITRTTFTVKSLIGYVGEQIAGVKGDLSGLGTRLSSVESKVDALSSQIRGVQNQVSSLSGVVYAAVGISVVSLIVAVAAVFMTRKSKT